MKTIKNKILTVEQGPIRPPSEARSLFFRFTRNCPWNKCLFCPVYKKQSFSLRTTAEIKSEIDTVGSIIEQLKSLSKSMGEYGQINDRVISEIFHHNIYSDAHRNAAAWLYYGEGSVFLQDANNLIMKTDDLVECLEYLHKIIPGISRVTTYARSKSLKTKSLEDLTKIKNAGLDRIHIGLETCHDPLLKFMKKGVSCAEQIEAGQKAVAAGFELSEYVMPGLGGEKMSEGHAVDTAEALNKINPHFIRLRTLRVPKKVELYKELSEGNFTPLSDEDCLREIRLFISRLEGINSFIASDHIMNLIETISGQLPEEKEKILEIIDRYFELENDDRLIYRIGRRAGFFRGPDDLNINEAKARAEQILNNIRKNEPGNEEEVIRQMADRYI